MKFIRPNLIGDAQFVSSTVPENDYAAWSAATTYAIGDRCIKAHRIWESSQAANINHDPVTSGLSWWFDVGPVNRWGMFDNKVGTVTSASGSFTVVLAPGRIDSIALLNVSAASVEITATVGVDVVYSRTITLIDNSFISDWFAYFFEDIKPKNYVVLTDLSPYGEAEITIKLEKFSGTVSCGQCVLGRKSDIGRMLSSPSLGINDYSKKAVDDFGNSSLVERDFSKRMGARLVVDNTEVDRVHDVLSSVRATPVVWIGSEDYSSMLIYGWFKDFEIDIAYKKISYCTLNIEGMI